MLVRSIGSAIATIVFALTSEFEIAVGLMALIGFTGAMWQNASQILLQNVVDGVLAGPSVNATDEQTFCLVGLIFVILI